MKSLLAAVAAAAAVLAPAAYADCSYPQAPSQIPDGSTATLKQMLAGMKAVSDYNHEMEGYLACIELERNTTVQAGAKLTKQQKLELEEIEIQKHNAAVDQLHAVADRFNAQVKIFKARGKKSD